MRIAAAAFCAMLVAGGTQAQIVYRCGTEYSQTPCPGGKILESSDPRSAAQRAEAVGVAAQDRRTAATLARERRALEAGTQPARATGFNGRPAADATAAVPPVKPKKSSRPKAAEGAERADFVAVEPGTPGQRAKRKAEAVTR